MRSIVCFIKHSYLQGLTPSLLSHSERQSRNCYIHSTDEEHEPHWRSQEEQWHRALARDSRSWAENTLLDTLKLF